MKDDMRLESAAGAVHFQPQIRDMISSFRI